MNSLNGESLPPFIEEYFNRLMSGNWVPRNMLLFIFYGCGMRMQDVKNRRDYIEEHFCQLAGDRTGVVRIIDMEGFLKYIDVLRM